MLRDGGNVFNTRFENIKINSHQVSPLHWWGRGEPISITNVKREEMSIEGTIYDVSFKNISCDSENGITIVGNNINDIIFDNVNLFIHDKTTWEKKDLDLRPSIYNVVKGTFHELYIKGNPNIKFINTNFKDIIKE